MALSDAVGESGGGKPAAMVSVKVDKLDTAHAAAMVMKAIKASDVSALEDALELFVAACEDKYGEGDDDKGYGGDDASGE